MNYRESLPSMAAVVVASVANALVEMDWNSSEDITVI